MSRQISKERDNVTARLSMVIEYEEFPEIQEIESLVEKAREYGYVKVADFVVLKATTRSLV